MEIAITVAAVTACSAVTAASIAAIAALTTSRQNLRQRRREQLIERAFDLAAVEHRAQLEEARRRADKGNESDTPAFQYYVTFNLVLLHRLSDLDDIHELDSETIARALDHASNVTTETIRRRAANRLSREKARNGEAPTGAQNGRTK